MRRKTKQVISYFISVLMLMVTFSVALPQVYVQADDEQPKTIAGLGTDVIKAPDAPSDTWEGKEEPWKGNFVWYGKYDGDPVKYRVLAPQTDLYGGNTMLLDSHLILYQAPFDTDNIANEGAVMASEWKYSDVRTGLNGDAFLNKAGVFTEIEKNAIIHSTIASHPLIIGQNAFCVSRDTAYSFEKYVALTGEKIFLLDAEDISNRDYGYHSDENTMKARAKRGKTYECQWWIRSEFVKTKQNERYCFGSYGLASNIWNDGELDNDTAYRPSIKVGVCPAFNVDRSSILFSSLVSGEVGQNEAEYKLTLIDSNMRTEITSEPTLKSVTDPFTGSFTHVTVPYKVSGSDASDATQLSYLVLDKEYTPGNSNKANVLRYGKVNTSDGFSTTGTGSFTIPNKKLSDWGISYFVYLIAEDVNGIYETDYASAPVLVENKRTIHSVNAKYSSITKSATQEFTAVTTSDVKYLMMYAEGGNLVKSWTAAGNSTVSSSGKRTWSVSQAIGTAGDRKLVFKGGTTSTTPVTNAVTVPFNVENSGVLSASVKNATIKKGGNQEFTVRTTSDMTYLMLYAEGGNLVKTWTANSSNSKVSGNVRTWTVSQSIGSAGNRNLILKAGKSTTPTSALRIVSFTVEDTWVNEASAKFATIGKGGTQTFTVKTTSNAQNLMLYAESGNLVKTWPASGNSTVSGDVRTWTVKLAIGTAGNRELTLKAGKTTTPSPFGKSVKFTVAEKKLVSANAKYNAITKASMQGFTVTTTLDVKYLMLYAEGGNLVKSWAASGNSSVAENNIRTWNVM